MARKLRVEYPGAIYPVMNRVDRREPIFLGDEDRVLFVQTLAETCQKTGWQVHAYCLMPNHFHLVGEAPRANFVRIGWRWATGARRPTRFGHGRGDKIKHSNSQLRPLFFVDGHVAVHDFTEKIKQGPDRHFEPTADWMWREPRLNLSSDP